MRVASLFVVVIGFGLLCGCKRRGDPYPGHPTGATARGMDGSRLAPPPVPFARTPEELAIHLERTGLKLSVRARPLLNHSGRTVTALSDDVPDHPATVFVYQCADEPDARDQAASMGAGAFVSGTFAVGTRGEATEYDRDLLAKIQATVGAPGKSRMTARTE